jgi:hypothetical protein
VIGEPPFEEGANQLRATPVVGDVAATRFVGAPGTVAVATGVADSSLEAAEYPTEFCALTSK